jgi:predicted MFS family arabinose efflux permease
MGGTIAHSANWMQSIAVPILVYQMTDSTSWLGIAAVAGQAPALIASPLGGAWADRYSKRLILLITLAVKATVAFAFFRLHATGSLTPLLMVGLLAVAGFASTANIAVWQPFVAEIVPRREIPAAYRLNAIQFNTSRAVGPALAGVVIAKFGMGTGFLLNAIAYAPLAITLAFVTPNRLPVEKGKGALRDLLVAARAVVADRRLWVPALIVTVTSTLGQGLHPLMAAIGTDVFHTDEKGIGYLISSIGVSSVVAALLVIWLGERVSRSALVRSGYILYVVGLGLVAATEQFWVGMLGFAVTGVAHVLVHVTASVSVQVNVDERLRGRVTALYLMGIIVGIPVGATVGGVVADATSMATVLTGAALGLASFGVFGQLFLRGFRDLDHG